MPQHFQTTESSVSFRLSRDLFNKLHHYAKQNDVTASQILRRLLASYEPVANAPADPLPNKRTWFAPEQQ